jgi:hypothetical protein
LTTTSHPSDARALIKAAGPTLPGPDEEMTADGEQLDPASSRALRRSLWRQVVFALLFTSGAFVTAAYYERQRRLGYLPTFSFFLFILNSFYLLFLWFFFVCCWDCRGKPWVIILAEFRQQLAEYRRRFSAEPRTMLETIQRMVGLDGMYLPDFSYASFALKLFVCEVHQRLFHRGKKLWPV